MAENAKNTDTVKPEDVKADATTAETPNATVPDALKSEAAVKADAVKPEEPKKLTDEEKKAIYDSLPLDDFRDTIDTVNKAIAEHNANNAKISQSEKNDPVLIKAEIFEENPKKNAKLAALRKKELDLLKQAEKLRMEAYAIIDTDGLMEPLPTAEEIEKLKAASSESLKALRAQVDALKSMEDMMPAMLKDKLVPLVDEITTRKGTVAKAGTGTLTGGSGAKRPKYKRVEVNGQTQSGENTVFTMLNGKEKYTSGTVAAYLRKMRKGFDVVTKDVTDAYFEGLDENNLPDEHTFTIYDTYKTESGHEISEPYVIKAYRG